MKKTGKELGQMLEKAFGVTLNAQQLWALVIFAKHVRLRARNNVAFNNLMNDAFPQARFRQVTKIKPNGETYPGLDISINGEPVLPEGGEDDE